MRFNLIKALLFMTKKLLGKLIKLINIKMEIYRSSGSTKLMVFLIKFHSLLEHFIVWMRNSGLKNFGKLYGRVYPTT